MARRSAITLLLGILTLTLIAHPARAQVCAGRYRLPEGQAPLITGSSRAAGDDAIVISGSGVAIESGCSEVLPRLKQKHGGTWKLTVRWRTCGSVRDVRLTATIPQNCAVIRGRLLTKSHRKPRRFSASRSRCGDGRVDPGEACDDGNFEGGDGCNDCKLPRCGDGVVDPGEECDDGNQDDGDGCTPRCTGTCEGQQVTSTWAAIQPRVFDKAGLAQALCPSGAAPAGGLDLTPQNAYANLINVPATIDPSWLRLVSGDQAESLLWRKLAAATHGVDHVPRAPMPQSRTPPSHSPLQPPPP